MTPEEFAKKYPELQMTDEEKRIHWQRQERGMKVLLAVLSALLILATIGGFTGHGRSNADTYELMDR
jgi:hypothetical protein